MNEIIIEINKKNITNWIVALKDLKTHKIRKCESLLKDNCLFEFSDSIKYSYYSFQQKLFIFVLSIHSIEYILTNLERCYVNGEINVNHIHIDFVSKTKNEDELTIVFKFDESYVKWKHVNFK